MVQLFTLLNESSKNWYCFSLCSALAISGRAVSSKHSQNFNTDVEIYIFVCISGNRSSNCVVFTQHLRITTILIVNV